MPDPGDVCHLDGREVVVLAVDYPGSVIQTKDGGVFESVRFRVVPVRGWAAPFWTVSYPDRSRPVESPDA